VCAYWEPEFYTGTQNNPAGYITILRPTVAMDHPIWYLGGVGGFGTYQVTGVLTANQNGATDTPAWTVTAGGTKVSLTCTNCMWTYITALAASSGCTYDVLVQASVGGFPSDTFLSISIDHGDGTPSVATTIPMTTPTVRVTIPRCPMPLKACVENS
jgi:hypothetical protein